MDWFRFYNDATHSKKLTRAAGVLGIEYMTALGYWSAVLCMANESPVRGWLMYSEKTPLSTTDFGTVFRVTECTAEAVIAALVSSELLRKVGKRLQVIGWNERQRQSDCSTERVRKHRANQAKSAQIELDGNGFNETNETVSETPSHARTEQSRAEAETEQNRAEQSRAEAPADHFACSLAIYRTHVLNGGNLKWRDRDRLKAMFEEIPKTMDCVEGGIFAAIHDFFKGCLPGEVSVCPISPYAQWQSEHRGERLGVALLRLKVEDAIRTGVLWSEKLEAAA